jgi:thioesterase domain-containing protein
MGDDQPVFGFQAVGLDGASQPYTRVEDMAAHYLEELIKMQPEGPYYLGGYCLGGTIALEMAKQLQQTGRHVALLALLETYNWSRMPPISFVGECRYIFEKTLFHVGNLWTLNSHNRKLFLRAKLDEARRRGRMWIEGVQNGRSGMVTIAEVWKANDQAAYAYQPTSYAGRITHIVPRREYTKFDQSGLAWSDLARDGVQSVRLRAYPAGMLMEPFVAELAERLNRLIDASMNS